MEGLGPEGPKGEAPCPDPGCGLDCPGTHGPVRRAAARWGTETRDSHRVKFVRAPGPRAGLGSSLHPMPGTSTWHVPAASGGQGQRLLITWRGGDWAGQGAGPAAGGSLHAQCRPRPAPGARPVQPPRAGWAQGPHKMGRASGELRARASPGSPLEVRAFLPQIQPPSCQPHPGAAPLSPLRSCLGSETSTSRCSPGPVTLSPGLPPSVEGRVDLAFRPARVSDPRWEIARVPRPGNVGPWRWDLLPKGLLLWRPPRGWHPMEARVSSFRRLFLAVLPGVTWGHARWTQEPTPQCLPSSPAQTLRQVAPQSAARTPGTTDLRRGSR